MEWNKLVSKGCILDDSIYITSLKIKKEKIRTMGIEQVSGHQGFWAGEGGEYNGLAQGCFGGDGTVLYPNQGGGYMTLSVY